jgi:hypothetical protein
MKAISLWFSLTCLVMVGCIGDPAIDTDEAELAAPDAGEEGGIATSPSAAPPTANIGGGDCLPEEAERGTCNGGGGGSDPGQCTPGSPGCETCSPGAPGCPGPLPPGPGGAYPPGHPCRLYPPGACPADPPKPPLAPPTENIIQPGCDAPPTDPNRVCEGDGGGGSGTGGGGGGGSGGGGTTSCAWGWHWVENGCGGLGCCQPNGPQPGDRCTRPPGTPPAGPWGEVCQRDQALRCVCWALPAPPVAPDVSSLAAPDEQNIIQPGCDAPPTDPYRVCEGDGGGGSGTGGGSGGGGTGGGSGSGFPCPPFHERVNGQCVPRCLAGYHWSSLYGQCIHSQTGQECMPPGWQDMTHADHCYWTTAGVCATYLNGGDCRCDYGYTRGGMEYGGEVYGQCYRQPTP